MLAAGPGEFKIRILMPASPQGIGLKSEQYGQRHFFEDLRREPRGPPLPGAGLQPGFSSPHRRYEGWRRHRCRS